MDPARALLAWYDRGHRDLPWRRSPNPWAIWVSEVMLQQTRVDTVGRYFERFLARFPDPRTLAEASTEELLAHWSGLGYYRRARSLQQAARSLAGAPVPANATELARLPGVGPYTAAAVASIAFGEPVPVLDGNVERVLARRLGCAERPARAAVRRRLLVAAAELLDAARPGDSNQALMELGATLCTPRAPRCPECPLAEGCAAHASGRPEAFPAPRARPAPRRVHQLAAVVGDAGRWLLVRRGESESVLPGMWELPTVEGRGARAAEGALARRFGGAWRLGTVVARLRHTITFRALELEARSAEWRAGGDGVREGIEARWCTAAEAGRLALTGATRKLLARLDAGSRAATAASAVAAAGGEPGP